MTLTDASVQRNINEMLKLKQFPLVAGHAVKPISFVKNLITTPSFLEKLRIENIKNYVYDYINR